MTDESPTAKYVIQCALYARGARACRGVLPTPGCVYLGEKVRNCETHA